MSSDRIATLTRLLERNPGDPRARLGLAMEYEKQQRWTDVARELQLYLDSAEDQGNAWGRLAHALRELGQTGQARAAYLRGIEAARAHHHPSMAAEFEEALEDLG
jgi:predicted Zn-dependent protease